MKKLFFIALGLSACAHMEKIDEAYTSKDPSFQKDYSQNVNKCRQASIKALQDLGAPLEEQRGNDLISQRWTAFESAVASGSGGYAVAQFNRQQAKMYVRVTGTPAQCNVRVTKVRAWNNNVEYEKLNLGFTKTSVVETFFKNVEDRLN